MIVHVDPGDPTPVYEQLRSQIARMIAVGTLAPGAQLPTIRQLAADLGLAKGTVAKAYESLLRDGVVEAAGRRGTLVRAPADAATTAQVTAEAATAARAFAVAVHQLGLDRASVHAVVDVALDELS